MEVDSLSLLRFLGYLRGDWKLKGVVEGDTVTVEMIEEEMMKLRPTLTPEENALIEHRKRPDSWDSLRETVKGLIDMMWQTGGAEQGYVTVSEVLGHPLRRNLLHRFNDETITRRIRECADEKIENPPYLLHWLPGKLTGRYRINVNAVRALQPEERKDGR